MVGRSAAIFVLSCVLAVVLIVPACGGGGGNGGGSQLTWTHPSAVTDNISLDGLPGFNPRAAMDDSGNALVVWEQDDGTSVQIFMSEYRGGAWTHPTGVTESISPFGTAAQSPQVATDNNGDAIVVWSQYDGQVYQVYRSEYRNGTWTHPENLAYNISEDGVSSTVPQVAMSDAGDAVIVWEQQDSQSNYQVMMCEYRNGAWASPETISLNSQWAFDPQVAMDEAGNAVVVWWQEDNGPNWQIYRSEYRNGVWTHPSSLDDSISPKGTNADGPQVAMAGTGEAVIVWLQGDGSKPQIFMSERRDGQWSDPLSSSDNISLYGFAAADPQVAMGRGGDAVIVWLQWDGAVNQVFKSERRDGLWKHPSGLADSISPDGTGAYGPQAAMDGAGDALIVWQQDDGDFDQVFLSECRGGAWTHPSGLADNISPDGSNAQSPAAAMSGGGTALVLWNQFEGSVAHILMSEYR